MSALHFVRLHRDRLLLALFVCFLYFYLRLFHNALIDDAFITLTYARNLALSGTWGFFPGHVTNTATSPLNVILLAILTRLARTTTDGPIWLALICFAVMALSLDRISSHVLGSPWWGRLATAALVFNPLLISTLGLESILFCTILVLCLWCFVSQRWAWLGFALGMLSVTRADGMLLAFVFLFFLPTSNARLRTVLTLLAGAAPWYIFSWVHLGSLVPDTLLIRLSDAAWSGWTFLDGPKIYLDRYRVETLFSFAYLPLLLALASSTMRSTPLVRLILALGAVHFVAYSMLRVPPYHWYFAPEADLLILFGAVSLGLLWRGWHTKPLLQLAGRGLAVLALLVPAVGMFRIIAEDRFRVTEMPIHSNLATHEQFKEAGLWLRDNVGQKTVVQEGEIGTLAYYCECYLLDPFSDRTWMREGVKRSIARGGLGAAIYAANFVWMRDEAGFEPPSYTLAVRPGRAEPGAGAVMQWLASTTWVKESQIVLSKR